MDHVLALAGVIVLCGVVVLSKCSSHNAFHCPGVEMGIGKFNAQEGRGGGGGMRGENLGGPTPPPGQGKN